jgi:hypothetical protein
MSLKTSMANAKSNKLVLGFAALAATAVIGTTGIAAAQTAQASAGYGGDTANVNLDLDISGDNNTVTIILNLFR